MQALLISLLEFTLLMILQALFINGVRQSMAGTTEVMPNGKDKDSEEIFYPFFKFITQKKDKRVYYEGIYLRILKDELYEQYKALLPLPEDVNAGSYLQFSSFELAQELKQFGDKILLKEKGVYTDLDGRHIRFYKVYDEYRFSKYLRKPFGQCIKCMASVYGAISFWPVVLYFFGFHLWQVPVFVADVFILAHLNYLFFKK